MSVHSRDEHLYQVSRIIEGVTACLSDFSIEGKPIDLFYAMELAGRLEFAVDTLRLMSGSR